MTTKTRQPDLPVSEAMTEQALQLTTDSMAASRLVLKEPDGSERAIPGDLQDLLKEVLYGAARGESLQVGRISDELTSTVAAEMLSVSRPTLMKMVKRGEIDSFKAGSHTRFRRAEVERVRTARRRDRAAAFAELRELDAEWDLGD